MSTNTTNLNLVKPEDADFFSKNHQNGNMDIIDENCNNFTSVEVKTWLGLTQEKPKYNDAFLKTITADKINRSVIATVTTAYGATQTTSQVELSTNNMTTAYVLADTKTVSVSGTIGYSRRLKLSWTPTSSMGNANQFTAYFVLTDSVGTVYTSAEINPYNTTLINFDIVQPVANTFSGTLKIYGKRNAGTYTANIQFTPIVAMDIMAYMT